MPSNKHSESPKKPAAGQDDLAGYEIIVALSGGIAAYKVCEVVSRLVQRGAGVTVAMTRSARRFVTPLTFEALSGRKVLTDLWRTSSGSHRVPEISSLRGPHPNPLPKGEGDCADIQHIELTTRADLIVMAPATANTIGKIAAGLADDVVTNLVISADSAVMLAPAMNNRMWGSAAVQRNVATVRQDGMLVVGPGEGWLACRSVGPGRMVDAGELVEAVAVQLRSRPPKQSSRKPMQ